MTRAFLTLLLGIAVTGCATLGFQLEGTSGPVIWRAEDLRVVERTRAAEKRQVYHFTFVIREIQGSAITFTHIKRTASSSTTPGISSEKTGRWELRPNGELRWPFSYSTYCRQQSGCAQTILAPFYDIVLTGTNAQGQPVEVAATLRLPPNPPAVRHTSPSDTAVAEGTPHNSSGLAVVAAVPIQIVNNRSYVHALANNKEQVLLLLDTGATRTVLVPDVADALDLRITPATPRRKMRVFGGDEVEVPFTHLTELAIADAVVKDLEIGVYPGLPQTPLIDGVLGGDFLNHFTVTIDHTASRLLLKSREAMVQDQASSVEDEGQQRFISHDKKFWVDKPPMEWKMTAKYRQAAASWKNRKTQSQIQIFAINPTNLSYPIMVKMMMSIIEIALQDKQFDHKVKMTLVEEESVKIKGKELYRVVADVDMLHQQDAQKAGKALFYFFKSYEFDYMIFLISMNEFFESEQTILDQMMQSFTYIAKPEHSS